MIARLFERARTLAMLPELLQHARQSIVSEVGLRIDEAARRWFVRDEPAPLVHAFIFGNLPDGSWDAYAVATRVHGNHANLHLQPFRVLVSARVVVCCDLDAMRVHSISATGVVRSRGLPFADVGNVSPADRVTVVVAKGAPSA